MKAKSVQRKLVQFAYHLLYLLSSPSPTSVECLRYLQLHPDGTKSWREEGKALPDLTENVLRTTCVYVALLTKLYFVVASQGT